MSADNKNLQSFLDEFYRDDSTKIIERVYLSKVKAKNEDEDEPKQAPKYLFTGERVCCESNLNILDFPMELLIKIFSYLSPTDLRVVAATCRQFFEATKYYKFMDHRVLHLNKITFSDWIQPVSDLNESSRVFHHVNLYLVHFPATSNYFWYIFGSYIKTLVFERCIVKKSKFLEILHYLDNLEELTICECNEMLSRWPEDTDNAGSTSFSLQKLRRINLQKITILKPHVFDFLFDMAPNLDALEVSLCFKKCVDSVLIKKMVEHSILALVRKKHLIKSLFFHGTPIDDLDLMKLVSIEGLSLERLSMTFTGRLLNPAMVDAARRTGVRNKKIVELGWILEFLRVHQNMVYLDLSDSLNLLDYCLCIIGKNMPNLKELRLKRCVMISDFGIKELANLKKLEVLDITGCEKITDKGIQEGVTGRWADWKENMKELFIGSNAKYTEHTIGFVTIMFLRLTTLDVSTSPSMTDRSLQLVIKHLKLLRHLNLSGCGQVSDAGLTGEGMEENRWRQCSISNLKGLQSLLLSGVYQITDDSLMKFSFLELKELSLAHCQMITEDGVFEFIQHCPSVEVLDLTDCHNINDACVEAITNRLQRLRCLSVACCNQITDRSIDSILTNCKELKVLHIRGCNRLTPDALRRLHRMTWLKYVYSN